MVLWANWRTLLGASYVQSPFTYICILFQRLLGPVPSYFSTPNWLRKPEHHISAFDPALISHYAHIKRLTAIPKKIYFHKKGTMHGMYCPETSKWVARNMLFHYLGHSSPARIQMMKTWTKIFTVLALYCISYSSTK